jgi:ABC-type bacteriocin/lantibiotic exporter with double-glycine peptidase domain
MSRRSLQLQTITGMLPMVISIGVLLVGALAVMNFELSVGRLFAVYATAAFITQPLVSLAGSCGGWAQAFHSLARLHEMVTLPHGEGGGALDFPADQSLSIEYQSVVLATKSPAPDPQAISFIAKPGTLTVLLGHSPGVANALVWPIKSLGTFARGRILLNGIDLKEYDLNRVRGAIAWAPSKADLLRGTLLENLTNWAAVPDVARIKDLCERFDLWEPLSSLPKGLHTEIGHGNYLFNPTMRRLLTLIRAFYQSTGGMVLEDPTLNLRSEQRRKVCSHMQELVQRGTCIIVATHDRDLAQTANQVIIAGDGRSEPRPKANHGCESLSQMIQSVAANPPTTL